MAEKRTFLERLTSLLRGGQAAERDPGEGEAGGSNPEMPLAREWATYQARKRELMGHEGRWVVVHGDRVLGVRPTYEEALGLGYEQAGYVDFLVHQIRASEPVHFLPPQPI